VVALTRSNYQHAWPQEGHDSANTSATHAWWKGELAPPKLGRKLHSAASPPVTVDRWIVYVSHEGRLVLLDHRTGQHQWETDMGLADDARIAHGGLPAPAITGEVVCFASHPQHVKYDGYLLCGYALDSGRQLWYADTEDSVDWYPYSELDRAWSPTVADGVVLVGDSGGRFYAINPANGSSRWRLRLGKWDVKSSSAAADGIAYAPTSDGIVHAIDIARGKVLWSAVTGGDSASIAVSGDALLAAAGDRLLAIDVKTGERRWRRRLQHLSRHPAISDGFVVAAGESVVYKIQVADGSVRWERQLEGGLGSASPSIAGDVIFVASENPARLYALSLADGRELWNVELDSGVIGAPVPLRGRVLCTLDNGTIDVWQFGRGGGSGGSKSD
jgi:outer membrane protein assembly factor BamB